MNLYSKLRGRIVTSDRVTEAFQFCRGIFTGDNYSPIIFNVVFQPLIDFLNTRKESQGYKLGEARIITKPFADDFELISNNKIQHQKLQTQIQKNASTMGLTFKPGKCRSLSISGGKPDPTVKFFLNDPVTNQPTQLKTPESDSHKFLGAVMTHLNTPQDHLKFLLDKLTMKLTNLNNSKVRGNTRWQCLTDI